jgi:hypothetical protein
LPHNAIYDHCVCGGRQTSTNAFSKDNGRLDFHPKKQRSSGHSCFQGRTQNEKPCIQKKTFSRSFFSPPCQQWWLVVNPWPGNTKGGRYHCMVDLLFDWFGISCMTTDNYCFYLQNSLIQIGQTGGQPYSDSSPFSIPCLDLRIMRRVLTTVNY